MTASNEKREKKNNIVKTAFRAIVKSATFPADKHILPLFLGDKKRMLHWYRFGRARQDELLRDAPEEWRAALNIDAIHQRVYENDNVDLFREISAAQYKIANESCTDHQDYIDRHVNVTVRLLEEMIATHSAPKCIRSLWESVVDLELEPGFDLLRLSIKYRDWPSMLLYLGYATDDMRNRRRRSNLASGLSNLVAELAELEQTDRPMHMFLLGARKSYAKAIKSLKGHFGNDVFEPETEEYFLFRDRVW